MCSQEFPKPFSKTANALPWHVLEHGKFVVEMTNGHLYFLPELEQVPGSIPVLIIPLKPTVEHLRDALLTEGMLHEQELLRFPPTPMPSTALPRPAGGQS